MNPLNLLDISKTTELKHFNQIYHRLNDHCVRLAVNVDETFDWHSHPNSDELFLVLEGTLIVEFENNTKVTLNPNESFCVEKGTIHRTIAVGKTVNLCFEKIDCETIWH